MTTTRELLSGMAQLIADANIGSWNPSGVYATSDTGIYMKTMPDGDTIPDRCIVLNAVPVSDDWSQPEGQIMVQVACRGSRGNPLDVDDIADAIFDVFQSRLGDVFGTTTVIQITRKGAVPMGQDAQFRWTRADKYFADVSVAATTRRPNGGFWD